MTTTHYLDRGSGAAERALVTFALFAYNQEKYIREAVEGAFSQTYEPLEIILSDDCSSDRTFEIMQEMAAEYKGPHRVRVRQNEFNLGIIDHVLSVADEARGPLMVVGAGDDISLPERSMKLAATWTTKRPAAVYSGCIDVDDRGQVVTQEVYPAPLPRVQNLFDGCSTPKRYDGEVRNIPGYSAAYDLEFLRKLPKTKRGIHNEDALTTYAANLLGLDILFIRETLLKRRISDTSISAVSSFNSLASVRKNEIVIQKFSKSTLGFLEYFSELRHLFTTPDYDIVLQRLQSDRHYISLVSSFWNKSFLDRFLTIFSTQDAKAFKYVIPRIGGIHVFCLAKVSAKKLRRSK